MSKIRSRYFYSYSRSLKYKYLFLDTFRIILRVSILLIDLSVILAVILLGSYLDSNPGDLEKFWNTLVSIILGA